MTNKPPLFTEKDEFWRVQNWRIAGADGYYLKKVGSDLAPRWQLCYLNPYGRATSTVLDMRKAPEEARASLHVPRYHVDATAGLNVAMRLITMQIHTTIVLHLNARPNPSAKHGWASNGYGWLCYWEKRELREGQRFSQFSWYETAPTAAEAVALALLNWLKHQDENTVIWNEMRHTETGLGRPITRYDQPRFLTCDGQCDKAWGKAARPCLIRNPRTGEYVRLHTLTHDPDPTLAAEVDLDDMALLSDQELGNAPLVSSTPDIPTGIYKPTPENGDLLNVWCANQCERSVITDPGDFEAGQLPDWSVRHYSMAHPENKE